MDTLERILAASIAIVEKEAPDAPDAIKDQAVVQLAGYLYDQPTSGTISTANAFRNSGAQLLLRLFVVRGALIA